MPVRGQSVAYIVSRYPKLSETFIVREMDQLSDLGWTVELFAFIHTNEGLVDDEARKWLSYLHGPAGPSAICRAQLNWLRERPIVLLSLHALIVRELWNRPGEMIRGFIALAQAGVWARACQARGTVHVHAHWARHPTVAALAIARLTGGTFSFTGHSADVQAHSEMLATKVALARFVVVPSQALRDTIVAVTGDARAETKIHVVRCGLDSERYAAANPHAPAPGSPPVLLTVARLEEIKGLSFLLRACKLLADRGRSFRCLIIGAGSQRSALERELRSLGLGDHVCLAGARSQRDVRNALASATAFVLPSIIDRRGRHEGVPVSLMEAMAVGVPVVATRTGAIPELVLDGRTGILVEHSDPHGLAHGIERLLDDQTLRDSLARQARSYLTEQFDAGEHSLRLHRLLLESISPAEMRDLLQDSSRSAPPGDCGMGIA